MTERIEQRYCIKFCQKLGDTQVETIRKIQQAFENEALSPTQIKQWFKRFKDGRASVESDPRSGRPSTSRNEEAMDQLWEEKSFTSSNLQILYHQMFVLKEVSFNKMCIN